MATKPSPAVLAEFQRLTAALQNAEGAAGRLGLHVTARAINAAIVASGYDIEGTTHVAYSEALKRLQIAKQAPAPLPDETRGIEVEHDHSPRPRKPDPNVRQLRDR